MSPRWLRSFAVGIGVALGVLGILVLIAIAPFVVEWSGVGDDAQWRRLSQIGQAYGIASVGLSALALCAVAVSTISQVRQSRSLEVRGTRAVHLELLKLAIAEPEYRKVLGVDFSRYGRHEWAQHAYTNLWFMYLQTAYTSQAINESGLRRVLADELFAGPIGVHYWPIARLAFTSEAASWWDRHFVTLVDDEHRKALESGVTGSGPELAQGSRAAPDEGHEGRTDLGARRTRRGSKCLRSCWAVVALAVVISLLTRRKRGRRA